MHALIDLRWMTPGFAGGIEHQMRAFVETLLRVDTANRYSVLLPSEVLCDFAADDRPNFSFLAADGPGYYLERGLWYLSGRRGAFRSPALARLSARVDVVYSAAGFPSSDFAALPGVVSVPDLQHEYLPDLFAPHELELRRAGYRKAIASAARVCAISEFTRQSILETCAEAADKVSVTPLAVQPALERLAGAPPAAEALRRFGLEPGYLYYPANTWAHKNHAALLRALAELARADIRPLLVCSGSPKEAQAELEGLAVALGLEGQVRFLGYLAIEDVATLYAHAAALVFPSLYEGFGMPVLEAMRFGCPVACSRAASLPEIAGEAALFFDPRDPADIAAALRQLLAQPELRKEFAARGLKQAARFSWLRHTLAVLDALRRAAGARHA